jgi:hypothetical protein
VFYTAGGMVLCIPGRRRMASNTDNPGQAAGAARGKNRLPLPELQSSSTATLFVETRCIASLPAHNAFFDILVYTQTKNSDEWLGIVWK